MRIFWFFHWRSLRKMPKHMHIHMYLYVNECKFMKPSLNSSKTTFFLKSNRFRDSSESHVNYPDLLINCLVQLFEPKTWTQSMWVMTIHKLHRYCIIDSFIKHIWNQFLCYRWTLFKSNGNSKMNINSDSNQEQYYRRNILGKVNAADCASYSHNLFIDYKLQLFFWAAVCCCVLTFLICLAICISIYIYFIR